MICTSVNTHSLSEMYDFVWFMSKVAIDGTVAIDGAPTLHCSLSFMSCFLPSTNIITSFAVLPQRAHTKHCLVTYHFTAYNRPLQKWKKPRPPLLVAYSLAVVRAPAKKTLLAVDPWNSHLITWAHGRRGGLACLSSSAMRERARAGARFNSRVGVQACATCGDISSDHRYYYNDSTSEHV
jgi:hypothetical protein